jgi:hypothetical protein
MDEIPNTEFVPAAKAIMDALVSALRVANGRLNKKAALALIRIGPDALPKLGKPGVQNCFFFFF